MRTIPDAAVASTPERAKDDASRPRKGVGFRIPVLLFMVSASALLIVVVSGAAHGML